MLPGGPRSPISFIDDPGCRKIRFISSPRPLSLHAPPSRGSQEKIILNDAYGLTVPRGTEDARYYFHMPRKSKKVRHLLSVNEKLPLLIPIPHDD